MVTWCYSTLTTEGSYIFGMMKIDDDYRWLQMITDDDNKILWVKIKYDYKGWLQMIRDDYRWQLQMVKTEDFRCWVQMITDDGYKWLQNITDNI